MKWKLTTNAIGEPEIVENPYQEQDEDLTLGYSLLRALAEHDHTMVEVAPGMWRVTTGPTERP